MLKMWLVESSKGKKTPFLAGSLNEVREKARQLAGKNYKHVVRVPEGTPMYDKYKKELTEAYSYIGYYTFLKKDNVKSKEAWKKVRELDPANKKADDALKILK